MHHCIDVPPKSFLVPMFVTAGQAQTFPLEITGETIWELEAISSDGQMGQALTGVRLQIQLPSGRYMFGGNGIDTSQFAWIGSYRYLVDPPEECEPGQKILVTLTNYGQSPLQLNLVFEGTYLYYLRGSVPPGKPRSALDIPRYQGILNENILAPSWMGGLGPETPAGMKDDYYVYSTPASFDPTTLAPTGTPIPLAGPVATTLKIPIDATADFICRRILCDFTADRAVTAGAILGRLRTGDGYSFNDEYIDLQQYLAGVEFPTPWKIRAGDAVFVDLVLVDAVGVGNVYAMVHLEGWKRKSV